MCGCPPCYPSGLQVYFNQHSWLASQLRTQGIAFELADISGMSNRRLQAALTATGKSSGPIGRILKRLRLHGLIKKVGKTYKHYLTELGRRAVLVGLKLKEHLIVLGLAIDST